MKTFSILGRQDDFPSTCRRVGKVLPEQTCHKRFVELTVSKRTSRSVSTPRPQIVWPAKAATCTYFRRESTNPFVKGKETKKLSETPDVLRQDRVYTLVGLFRSSVPRARVGSVTTRGPFRITFDTRTSNALTYHTYACVFVCRSPTRLVYCPRRSLWTFRDPFLTGGDPTTTTTTS